MNPNLEHLVYDFDSSHGVRNNINGISNDLGNAVLSTVYLANARSLMNKKCDFDALFLTVKPDVIGITETWLEPDLTFAVPPDFSAFRCDRSSGRGGGVMLVVSSSLAPGLVGSHRLDSTEVVHVSILEDTLLSLVYRPPSASASNLIELCENLRHYSSLFRHVYILGDFNLPISLQCWFYEPLRAPSPTMVQLVRRSMVENLSVHFGFIQF